MWDIFCHNDIFMKQVHFYFISDKYGFCINSYHNCWSSTRKSKNLSTHDLSIHFMNFKQIYQFLEFVLSRYSQFSGSFKHWVSKHFFVHISDQSVLINNF